MENTNNQLIDRALNQQPSYNRLENLQHDVWRKIYDTRKQKRTTIHFPLSFQLATAVLSLVALLTLSQISFTSDQYQADFSIYVIFPTESIPSLNIASIASYEYTQ